MSQTPNPTRKKPIRSLTYPLTVSMVSLMKNVRRHLHFYRPVNNNSQYSSSASSSKMTIPPGVHTLPNEILLEIFDIALNRQLPDTLPKPADYPAQLIRLQMVCRRWRNLVRESTYFWSAIDVQWGVRWMDLAVSNVHEAPASLRWHTGSTEYPWRKVDISHIPNAVADHMDRWGRLDLDLTGVPKMSREWFTRFFTRPAPLLHSLSWSGGYFPKFEVMPRNLNHLTIFYWNAHRDALWTPIGDLFRILYANHGLQSLGLNGPLLDSNEPLRSTLLLPNLTSVEYFRLDNASIIQLLTHIEAPRCNEICLSSLCEPNLSRPLMKLLDEMLSPTAPPNMLATMLDNGPRGPQRVTIDMLSGNTTLVCNGDNGSNLSVSVWGTGPIHRETLEREFGQFNPKIVVSRGHYIVTIADATVRATLPKVAHCYSGTGLPRSLNLEITQ
ncbi:hypothetical protein FRB99_008756 [Tulasnella sp. 403]|nr:hypothetical protein FRB99_008756 [Tulasnella sp. 403]